MSFAVAVLHVEVEPSKSRLFAPLIVPCDQVRLSMVIGVSTVTVALTPSVISHVSPGLGLPLVGMVAGSGDQGEVAALISLQFPVLLSEVVKLAAFAAAVQPAIARMTRVRAVRARRIAERRIVQKGNGDELFICFTRRPSKISSGNYVVCSNTVGLDASAAEWTTRQSRSMNRQWN